MNRKRVAGQKSNGGFDCDVRREQNQARLGVNDVLYQSRFQPATRMQSLGQKAAA